MVKYQCILSDIIPDEYFNLSEYVKPICLPYEDDAIEDYQSSQVMKDSKFWVAGWGATTERGNYFIHAFI